MCRRAPRRATRRSPTNRALLPNVPRIRAGCSPRRALRTIRRSRSNGRPPRKGHLGSRLDLALAAELGNQVKRGSLGAPREPLPEASVKRCRPLEPHFRANATRVISAAHLACGPHEGLPEACVECFDPGSPTESRRAARADHGHRPFRVCLSASSRASRNRCVLPTLDLIAYRKLGHRALVG
jgi:hypothetical protein